MELLTVWLLGRVHRDPQVRRYRHFLRKPYSPFVLSQSNALGETGELYHESSGGKA